MRAALLTLIIVPLLSVSLFSQGKLAVLNPQRTNVPAVQTAHASPHLVLDNKTNEELFIDVHCIREDWSGPKVLPFRIKPGGFVKAYIPYANPANPGDQGLTGSIYKITIKSPSGENEIDLGHSPIKSIPIFNGNRFAGYYAWVGLINAQKNLQLCLRTNQGASGQCTMIQ